MRSLHHLLLLVGSTSFLACVISCGGGSAPTGSKLGPNEELITKEQFGDEWPFTVDEGVLAFKQTGKLSDGTPVGAVTFTTGGKTYGINGIACGKAFGHADVDEIWADDPKISGAKKNIGGIIDRGLKLSR